MKSGHLLESILCTINGFLLLQSVWGSYWEEGKWGYACCHSLLKGSYCTGEAGKLARKVEQSRQPMEEMEAYNMRKRRKDDPMAPTEEEIEAYNMRKRRKEDPMAQFV